MEIKWIYPRWGSAHLEWEVFLSKVKEHGYHGVEIDLPFGPDKKEIATMLTDFELDFVGQHWQTQEVDHEKHMEEYKRHLYNLAEEKPLLINSHTGRDFFSFEQNLELIKLAQQVEVETGVPIAHETHRSRFPFAAHVCKQYLHEITSLKLTSDLSHWCCVAETLLENQQEAVDLAIQHTYHIHARVGSTQSPQVMDPRVDTYQEELAQFKKWWKAMLENAESGGRPYITIAPEYGPLPYALQHPQTGELLGDQWEINQFIRKEIEDLWD
ncbi:sugar phosphate isomerase/epimerase family protein [Flagellimonas flava]|uniref:Sugar phosphate isomerase/epimerase n=1 Tax=Flagellimonas flava TaxID=570519 RepID=A0A1M5J3Z4_9FLAO|nr:hypothetical protein [Allomuricauda flava]SHG35262.1 Sugar phosphate isomerase/epimerase [Allomuricauda flava]